MTTLNPRLRLALLNRKKPKNILEQGFTLVELMIVIVIVGILSAVALPNFLNQTEKAKAAEPVSQISAAFKNAQMVYIETNAIPGSDCADVDLKVDASGVKGDWTYTCGGGTSPVYQITAVSGTSPNVVTVFGSIDLQTGEMVTKPKLST